MALALAVAAALLSSSLCAAWGPSMISGRFDRTFSEEEEEVDQRQR